MCSTVFAEYLRCGLIKGYGTYQIKDRSVLEAAVQNGYNFFDTAELYKNEDLVIDVIKSHPESQLFVSTKISYIAIEKEQIEKSFYERLEKFKGLKINLLLLHKPSDNCRRDWSILCELYAKHRDKIDHIGVSNYDLKHLNQINDLPMPFANQFELSPFNVRSELVEYCKNNGIVIVSHTTLTRTVKFNCTVLVSLANKYQASVAKILLRWAVQNGYITIPRSSKLDHLMENIKESHFSISHDDMQVLNGLNEGFILTKVMF
jgi:diketogulonate reductase-like aldo/keto reductase